MRWRRPTVAFMMICGVLLALGTSSPLTSAAEPVVVGDDSYPCTRDGLVSAIGVATTDNPTNPGLVTFNCPDPTITFTSNITIGASGIAAVTIDGRNNGNPMIFDGGDSSSFFEIGNNGYLTVRHLSMHMAMLIQMSEVPSASIPEAIWS